MMNSGGTYSKIIGAIYVFNLIVGTGSLAIPKSFLESGYILGSLGLLGMAFLSFITVTYLIETMSILNAYRHIKYQTELSDENRLLSDHSIPFRLYEKIEMLDMVKSLYGKIVTFLFLLNITIYLYGDIAIYSAIVAKSFRNMMCDPTLVNSTSGGKFQHFLQLMLSSSSDNDALCWSISTLTRINVYRIFLVAFLVVIFPTYLFRANWIQLTASIYRWISLFTMIILAFIRIFYLHQDPPQILDPIPHPKPFLFKGILSLVGILIYSFMCHHSLPGIITPIRNNHKDLILKFFTPIYLVILCLYFLLSISAVFAFNSIEDFYTLNFIPEDLSKVSTFMKIIDYFLVVYPVVAVTSNFSIMSNTLSENLMTIIPYKNSNEKVNKLLYGLLAIIPGILIAMTTSDIEFLVSFTGAFAGSGIQYIFPVLVIYKAKQLRQSEVFQEWEKKVEEEPDLSLSSIEYHKSKFTSKLWYIGLLIWSLMGVVMILTKKIMELVQKS